MEKCPNLKKSYERSRKHVETRGCLMSTCKRRPWSHARAAPSMSEMLLLIHRNPESCLNPFASTLAGKGYSLPFDTYSFRDTGRSRRSLQHLTGSRHRPQPAVECARLERQHAENVGQDQIYEALRHFESIFGRLLWQVPYLPDQLQLRVCLWHLPFDSLFKILGPL